MRVACRVDSENPRAKGKAKAKGKGKAKAKAKPKAKAAPAPGPVDEFGQLESELYKEKMGQVSKGAWRGLNCDLLFLAMEISSKCREPWDAFSHSMMKHRPKGEPTSIARMVWFRAQQIALKFEALCRPEAWEDYLEEAPLCYRQAMEDLINQLSLSYAADFDRRVIKVLQTFPYQLLMMAKKKGHEPCDDRKLMAQRLLDASEESLHITALKVRVLFIKELTDTKITGMVPCYLYGIFYVIACMWRCDVQDIEGMSNIVQMVARKAPFYLVAVTRCKGGQPQAVGLGPEG